VPSKYVIITLLPEIKINIVHRRFQRERANAGGGTVAHIAHLPNGAQKISSLRIYQGTITLHCFNTSSVMDVKSRGQPDCQEEQKACKEESLNVMHECDV
jgi:hypothetical protein